jgi:hypothetical protein
MSDSQRLWIIQIKIELYSSNILEGVMKSDKNIGDKNKISEITNDKYRAIRIHYLSQFLR